MDISIAPYLQFQQPVKRIFLWGMMGVGKTTYGKLIAKHLNWNWIDLDVLIESQAQESIQSIFKNKGEQAFRDLEVSALTTLLNLDSCVISVGGGTPCFADLGVQMKNAGLCIWLDAPVDALVKRLSEAKTIRPLVEGKNKEELKQILLDLYIAREAYYKEAHMIVNVLKLKPDGLANQLRSVIPSKP
jgi:shikimate kinase